MKNVTTTLLCAIGLVAFLATSCTVDPPATAISQPDLVKMPSFQATLQRSENGNVATGGNLVDGNWVAGYFATTNGSRVCLGGPGASAEMIAFIRSLSKGQTYKLPDVFITFQKSQTGNKS